MSEQTFAEILRDLSGRWLGADPDALREAARAMAGVADTFSTPKQTPRADLSRILVWGTYLRTGDYITHPACAPHYFRVEIKPGRLVFTWTDGALHTISDEQACECRWEEWERVIR